MEDPDAEPSPRQHLRLRVDQVNKEIEVRFDRSTEIAHTLSEDASAYVADLTILLYLKNMAENAVPFVVFNTTGDERTGKVTVVLDAKRDYNKWLWDGRRDMKAWELPSTLLWTVKAMYRKQL